MSIDVFFAVTVGAWALGEMWHASWIQYQLQFDYASEENCGTFLRKELNF